MSIIRRKNQEEMLQTRESTTKGDKGLVGSAEKTTAAMQEMAGRKGKLVAGTSGECEREKAREIELASSVDDNPREPVRR